MDYEKKYKEALELARVAAFNGHQSLMEGIFPELAESEDEKTRKRIIALVNAHGQGMYKDDMLAWLEKIEKQGEQKPQRIISAEAKEAMYDKPACAWSEEDEEHYKACLQYFDEVNPDMVYYKDYQWLKSLKQKIGGKL